MRMDTEGHDSKEMLPIEVPPDPPGKRKKNRISCRRRLNRNWKSLLRERLAAVDAEHYES